MPTLLFASLEALGLALGGGAAPAEMPGAPGRGAVDPQGRVWLQIDSALTRDTSAALGRLGVTIIGGNAETELSPVSCWFELLPLLPAACCPVGPILLAVPARKLGQTAAEVRRLSPESKLHYRLSESSDDALLEVERCPVFSLTPGGERAAFYEQAPRVWVEAGFEHLLAHLVQPPADQLAMIRAPARWSWLSDEPFEREIGEFRLMERRSRFVEGGGLNPIALPLRLVEGGAPEPAELWLLRERPVEQLQELARQSGQAFLERFRWALLEEAKE